MATEPLAQKLQTRFTEWISGPVEFREEITLTVKDPQKISEICAFARQELGFDFLVDISSVDNYGEEPRFTVVYELYGHAHQQHLRLKTDVAAEAPELPTVTGIWRGADWHEREIFDMMGIKFAGHPDLRRILMWEGYPHYPLRKDFPVAGKPTAAPEVAFSKAAPIEGGPFVTADGAPDAGAREPRAHETKAEEPS